jgi:hypothetical protein
MRVKMEAMSRRYGVLVFVTSYLQNRTSNSKSRRECGGKGTLILLFFVLTLFFVCVTSQTWYPRARWRPPPWSITNSSSKHIWAIWHALTACMVRCGSWHLTCPWTLPMLTPIPGHFPCSHLFLDTPHAYTCSPPSRQMRLWLSASGTNTQPCTVVTI